jgi:hypothetical protein
MSLGFMQDWSVKYDSGENIGILPAKNSDGESFRVFWLASWSGDKKQYTYHEPDIRAGSRLAV